MVEAINRESDQAEVTPKTSEGVEVRFVNPKVLRASLLDPKIFNSAGLTLAERMSGIREIPLGEYPLDGQLFQLMRVTLVIEPDRDPRGDRPTAIIRADLQLGKAISSITNFQAAKENQHETEGLIGEVEREFSILPKRGDVYFMPYTGNTARIYPHPLAEGMSPQMPLVLLQVWDKDIGKGSISISLLSDQKYRENWRNRHGIYQKRMEDGGGEIDYDEVDRWQFHQQVGINVYVADDFYRSLNLFEHSFSLIIRALYQAEGIEVPTFTLEIGPPLISKEREGVIFTDIGGQKAAVDFMRALVEMEKSGSILPQRPIVLLAGPPGNGKTSLAQATANELGAKLLVTTTRDLPPSAKESDYIDLIEAGYFEAKAAAKRGSGRAVYCIEGLESILGNTPRIHDRFLNAMDSWAKDPDRNVLVIATTNFPDDLHPGIISRFQKVDVSQPTMDGLAEILKIKARKLTELAGLPNLFSDNINFQKIAQLAENFSGRDAETLLARAYYLRMLQVRENTPWKPIDSKFLFDLIPNKTLGFHPAIRF